jgi:hypothetical protein
MALRGTSIGARPHDPAPSAPLVPPAASPPARRAPRSRWRDPRLAVGVGVVALCALLGGRLFAGADDLVAVWAARSSMHAGQRVQAGDLVSRQVRFADQADADLYLSAGGDPPTGVLARSVGAGELLPRAAIGARSAPDLTEVPLSVDTEAVPSTLHVGSTVDVWVSAQTPASELAAGGGSAAGRTGRAALVLDDVSVVALPAQTASLGPTATRQVVVGVGDDQRSRLPAAISALSGGAVVLTTRR